MNKTFLIGIFSLILFSACGQNNKAAVGGNTTNKEVVIKRVTKEEFKNYLAAHPSPQIIDVRTPQEYAQGTIEGAKNIDFLGSDFEKGINELDKETPTLIFCRSGGRSSRALKVFEKNGFTTVFELEGGYLNW